MIYIEYKLTHSFVDGDLIRDLRSLRSIERNPNMCIVHYYPSNKTISYRVKLYNIATEKGQTIIRVIGTFSLAKQREPLHIVLYVVL